MPETKTYDVTMIFTEEGVSISCPALPGCHSQGVDEADALDNIQDAIREYLLSIGGEPDWEYRQAQVTV